MGYVGGKVRIIHCLNVKAAETMIRLIREQFPSADVLAYPAGALCSFYAEQGGMLIGFEVH